MLLAQQPSIKSQDTEQASETPWMPGGTESREAGFDRLVKTYGSALMRLVTTYEADRADQEDLYQDICLAIWQALLRFRNECSERTFIYRIAHNRGITHRQRKKPAGVPLDETVTRIADSHPSPEINHQRAQRHERLMNAVRQLPDIQRQIVVLSLEELTHKEIAQIVGTTENNIAVRLNRARKALRNLLTGQKEHVR